MTPTREDVALSVLLAIGSREEEAYERLMAIPDRPTPTPEGSPTVETAIPVDWVDMGFPLPVPVPHRDEPTLAAARPSDPLPVEDRLRFLGSLERGVLVAPIGGSVDIVAPEAWARVRSGPAVQKRAFWMDEQIQVVGPSLTIITSYHEDATVYRLEGALEVVTDGSGDGVAAGTVVARILGPVAVFATRSAYPGDTQGEPAEGDALRWLHLQAGSGPSFDYGSLDIPA